MSDASRKTVTEPPVELIEPPRVGGSRTALAEQHPLSTKSPAVVPARKLAIPIVVGTRPEAIKLVPVILALRESEHFEPIVVSTGQHSKMVQFIFELAGISTDVQLRAGVRRSNLNERVATVLRRFEDFCADRFELKEDGSPPSAEEILAGDYPIAVMVHGDTSSAMAAALASFHLHIPVLHVEAGLRTGGLNLSPFPEELNRELISAIASLHFAPTSQNLQHLVREDVDVDQIFVTGNTGIDALQWATKLDVRSSDPDLNRIMEGEARVVVVTAHRRENWGNRLAGIAEAVGRLAGDHPETRFVVPVHPNPKVAQIVRSRLEGVDNVLLVEALGYAVFAKLLGRCDLVITDSGGIQEEAPSLNKPVLVTRDSTERLEGITAGTLKLVGTDPDVIFAEADRLLADAVAYAQMAEAPNPYGDGKAAERIVACMEHLLVGGTPPTQFGPGYNRAAVARAAGFDHDGELAMEVFGGQPYADREA